MRIVVLGADGELIPIESPGPLYWVRRHTDKTDNAGRTSYQDAIFHIRHELTRTWQVPEWTR